MPEAPPCPDARWSAASLRADALAGLTTAVLLVPQSMAYALLAGLPPIVGLYAAVVPLVAYALVGSSRELAIGPVAMDSLLTAATVGVLAQSGTDRYIELAALLALMVGAVQILMGTLRGGFLANFLSRPVVSGFSSAAALIIAASQLRLLLGVDLPRSTSVFEIVYELSTSISDVHLLSAGVAVTSMLLLWALKRWRPRWPRALIVVTVAIIASGPLGLSSHGLAVVGDIPAGLPQFRIPDFSFDEIAGLGAGAITIAFVAFMEGISISTILAEKKQRRINANREFLGLGLANLSAGVFGGYPVAGGFSRTAVNAEAGAKSKLAGVISAGLVALTLAFFTPLLRDLPKASLGAIIVMAVVTLLDIGEVKRLWRVKRSDLAMLIATFAATLVLGIQYGILAGVGLSIVVLVVRTTRPHSAVLGYLPDAGVYRNIERFPEALTEPGVIVLRLDAQLYFGNVSFLRDRLRLEEDAAVEPVRAVIIDASAINQLDSSAEKALRDLWHSYRARNIEFVLAGPIGPVRDVLERSGLKADLGETGIASSVRDAMTRIASMNTDDPQRKEPAP